MDVLQLQYVCSSISVLYILLMIYSVCNCIHISRKGLYLQW